MGGGDSSERLPEEDHEEKAAPLPTPPVSVGMLTVETFSGARLADAPILLLVYFHKALREEIADVRRAAVAAAEGGLYGRGFVGELQRRFEFLKLAYKYHCAAEDEVVFQALDMHVKNVACTYSLEHESIDDLFGSIFNSLNVLMDANENISKAFQDLLFCIGTFQSSICQHMLKEEQQVFPLLVQQFSIQEQASLVWQFFCSVPVMLLEDFLPWMISFLPPKEQVEVAHCLKEVVPKEKSLQEVVISWLGKYNQSSSGDCAKIAKGVQCPDRSEYMKNIFRDRSSKWASGQYWHCEKVYFLHTNVGYHPVDGLHLWHNAIKKDLKEILEELCQIKISSSSHRDLIVVRLKFLADVLIFYSNALEKFFYPVLTEINGHQTIYGTQFSIQSHVESLQRLLYHNAEDVLPMCEFVEKLRWKLESFVVDISRQFTVQETEVFAVIGRNCSHEIQQQLLYMGLHVLPLGLLKCVITWFSAHLSEDESRSILHSLSQEGSFVNKSFASLLLEWFRIGYSGKISIENFSGDLQKMFKSRCSFLPEQIMETIECSSLLLDMQQCKGSNPRPIEPVFPNKGKKCLSPSSPGSHASKKYETPYSSGINLHIFFPGKIRPLQPIPECCFEKSCTGPVDNKPIPMDLIFFFHKALKKDLGYLVSGSAQLAENVGFLLEFHERFHLMEFLYQIQTDAEDEIAFPALEAKGKLQNISHSYTIDHKLKVEHFNKISLILDEMSELVISVSSIASNTLDKRNVKYHLLCMNLQDMCKSLHKLLSDHVHREEIVLWPLFRECFSIEEQEKIIGCMLGRIRAEILQDMIHWLMASLTSEEQHAMMSLWRQATKKTMFDEWLAEWWEDYEIAKVVEDLNILPSWTPDPLEIISTYLSKEVVDEQRGTFCEEGINFPQTDSVSSNIEPLGKSNVDDKPEVYTGDDNYHGRSEYTMLFSEGEKKTSYEVAGVTCKINNPGQFIQVTQKSRQYEHLLTMSQEDLEAAIRRVSRDSSLDPQEKSYITQNLLMSQWIVRQQISNSEVGNGKEILGQHPSYRDPVKLTFGCEHYKRNCKLFTACCNQIFTCIRCHDEVADHLVDRKSIRKMMCMKCLIIQPIGPTCSSVSCNNLSMGKYYCRICKLFDDEREIYHCPYCNLCRVGKGLGIDYFHCMNCNACMSRSLSIHICRDKCLEDNCPICHEYIFTSNSPVKALPCGHLMHSICFRDYTCTHYTCPICSKSLGDMQVYFGMLDALLAEEKIPSEYSGQTQVILCNDCERKGKAPFHWLYHKCSYCGSYNTRVL